MKKKLTMSIAVALMLALTASIAFAAVKLIYSPSASAVKLAREALIEQYGLSHTTLGLFTYSLSAQNDATTVTFYGDLMAAYGGNAGNYTVTVHGSDVTASWTYDHAAPALWQSGDLSDVIWGPQQLERFLREKTIGGTICDPSSAKDAATSTPTPIPVQTPDEELTDITTTVVTPGPNDLTQDDAIAIARAALTENFGLTEENLSDDAVISFCRLMQIAGYPPRCWCISVCCQMDGYDWNMYIEIDASSGEILCIDLQTGGNG